MSDTQRWVAAVSDEVMALMLASSQFQGIVDRFHSKIDYGFGVNDCWVWTGALSDEGYGDFWLPTPLGPRDGKTVRAHRFSYVLTYGEIPCETPYLDHLRCIGRFCVNAKHLEPVTNEENLLRSKTQINLKRTEHRSTRNQLITQRQSEREQGIF